MIPHLLAEQANADTIFDLVARFVDQLPAVLTAAAGVVTAIVIAKRGAARHEAAAEDLAAVRESVVNDHTRPIRYDVDDLAAAIVSVRGDVADLGELTETIGREVREDRKTRRDEDKALDERRRAADKQITDRLDATDARIDAALTWAKTVTAENHPQSPAPPDGI